MNTTKSETDWERVQAFQEGNAIPYGPYDPNDAEAPRPAKGSDKDADLAAPLAGGDCALLSHRAGLAVAN
ncbi:MAG: hypothetical protein ABR906_02160 [Terracidiphilus sp.]|jgi:hypothetical protein